MDANNTESVILYKLEILVPVEIMGDVIGDLNSCHGKLFGMDANERSRIIRLKSQRSLR